MYCDRALHRNSLHGPIPIEIKNCTDLRALYTFFFSVIYIFSLFFILVISNANLLDLVA